MKKVFYFFLFLAISYTSVGQVDSYIQDSLKRVLPINASFQDSLRHLIDTTQAQTANRGIKLLSKDTAYASVYIYTAYLNELSTLQNSRTNELNFMQQQIADTRKRYQDAITALRVRYLSNPPTVPPKL